MMSKWKLIDSVPETGYFLVYEDGAIRAKMRINGAWKDTAYPALVASPWSDVLVGDDAKRVLEPLGYRLDIRDGCCLEPTHWMEMPDDPEGE